MQTIYQYNKDFDKSAIINKMNDLSEQIKEEQTKDNDEYNKEKELELILRSMFLKEFGKKMLIIT